MEGRLTVGVARLRAALHRRYLRAAVGTLALAAVAGTVATGVLQLRFGVPAHAVVRYFVRLHDTPEDLKPLLLHPDSMARLADLAYTGNGTAPGGLVYTVDGRLELHPWMPLGDPAADGRAREHERLYHRLLASYLAADLDRLLAELSRPETRRELGRLGVAPAPIGELQRAAAGAPAARRQRLLRRAGRLILPFMPTDSGRHGLDLADKLRFYASNAPRGRYLGLYEVRGPRWLATGRRPAEPLPETGRRLVITKLPAGELLVEYLSARGRRVYRLTPMAYPGGRPLYRLAWRA